ncbi:MAG: adenosylcobinamide-phosphate synthase CbiB [Spirochaetaceae bacterium]|nr:adenosylcobinamide-phosphate synthase CbiB [Spirochaetaceae bacterium]
MILAAFILDALLGDPRRLPHPVRGFGFLITHGEAVLRRRFPARERLAGTLLTLAVTVIGFAVPYLLVSVAFSFSMWAGLALGAALAWQALAARGLYNETMAVYHAAKRGGLDEARTAVSMIVGRDTAALPVEGVVKAAVETAAENLCDGVIAPLFYLGVGFAIGGPALAVACAFFYKAASTLDSMIGYKNQRYVDFGRSAARLDDVLSFIPARISAILLVAAAFLTCADAKNALRIWLRDRKNHASPNAGQGEAAMAGALGLRLGGGAFYGGIFEEKPAIGDATREAELTDIQRACTMMYIAALLFLPADAALEAVFWWRTLCF